MRMITVKIAIVEPEKKIVILLLATQSKLLDLVFSLLYRMFQFHQPRQGDLLELIETNKKGPFYIRPISEIEGAIRI